MRDNNSTTKRPTSSYSYFGNGIALPSYFLTEAAIFYKQDRFKAALNFKNLFDVDYFESADSRLNVFYGDPFTVQATISWQF